MFTLVNELFVNWLNGKLVEKGWSQADLSKRAQVSTAMISSVLSGRREPGINFCNSIAAVLRVPPEDVYRLAGLLPSSPSLSVAPLSLRWRGIHGLGCYTAPNVGTACAARKGATPAYPAIRL